MIFSIFSNSVTLLALVKKNFLLLPKKCGMMLKTVRHNFFFPFAKSLKFHSLRQSSKGRKMKKFFKLKIMDSDIKNEFPVGKYVRVQQKRRKLFFWSFFAYIIFLFGRLTEICSKNFFFKFQSV